MSDTDEPRPDDAGSTPARAEPTPIEPPPFLQGADGAQPATDGRPVQVKHTPAGAGVEWAHLPGDPHTPSLLAADEQTAAVEEIPATEEIPAGGALEPDEEIAAPEFSEPTAAVEDVTTVPAEPSATAEPDPTATAAPAASETAGKQPPAPDDEQASPDRATRRGVPWRRLTPYLAGVAVLAVVFAWLGVGAYYRTERSALARNEAAAGLDSGRAAFDALDGGANGALAAAFGPAVQRTTRVECTLTPATNDTGPTWQHACTQISVTAYEVTRRPAEQLNEELARAAASPDASLGESAPDPRAVCPVLRQFADGPAATSTRHVPGAELDQPQCAPAWAPPSTGDTTVRLDGPPRSVVLSPEADFLVLTVSREFSRSDVGCKPLDLGCARPFLTPVAP